MEGHFPPRFLSVWVLPNGRCVTESPAELTLPYTPKTGGDGFGAGRDFNLNATRWQMLDLQSSIAWLSDWSQHCVRARSAVLELDEFRSAVRHGLTKLREQHEVRTAQLTARSARLAPGAARDAELADLEAERHQHRRLTGAVTFPSIRIDAVGATFVAPTCPFVR